MKNEPAKDTPEYFAKYPWARVEQPTVTPITNHNGDTTRTTHPAFGQVTVSRISGHTTLYDSEFNHQHFVRVTLHGSELERSLARDWHFQKRTLVEFDLSEAQWAAFVSSFGSGSGTCCTIRFVAKDGLGHTPQLPEPRVEKELHTQDGKEAIDAVLGHLADLQASLVSSTSKLPAKTRAELVGHVQRAKSQLTSTLPFIADSFGEHMETVVEKAKAEVHGYVQHHITRAGLEALGGPITTESPRIEDKRAAGDAK